MLIEDLLNNTIKIDSISREYYEAVKTNWDKVAKPLDSLGVFESVVARIGAIRRSSSIDIAKKIVVMMIADNGIVARGVSQCGQEVTSAVAVAMGKQVSSVGKMARAAGVDTMPIDIGINGDETIEGVIDRKVAMGTNDFLIEPAMSREEVLRAIEVGIDTVKECADKGYSLVGMGEMGIGNTTTSSCVATILLDLPAKLVTGKGAGLSDDGLKRKIGVVEEAKKIYGDRASDSLEVLRCVGGLDIAGLVGIAIGGAYYHMPIVLDGVISVVAAYTACKMFPEVSQYLIASHVSREPVAGIIMDRLELVPVVHADMALGEGTGGVMMMSLLDLATALYEDKTTFGDMNIDAYQRFR